MKKTLLALALMTGFAGVTQAETSVTLYGVLDGGIAYQRLKGTVDGKRVSQKYTGMINAFEYGNRWGLRGTEDLGEGLQAVFQLESGFDLGTGQSAQGGRLFGRQATVGLRSDAWGRLDLGRQATLGSNYVPDVASPFNNSFGLATVGTVIGGLNTVYLDNMIMYQTPVVSGLQLGVGYSFNRSGNQRFGANNENSRAWTAAIRYSNGPLALAASYDRNKAPHDEGGVRVSDWTLAASYDFDVAAIYAGFGQSRNGWQNSVDYIGFPTDNLTATQVEDFVEPIKDGYIVNDGMKVNSYSLGVSAPLGGGTLMAAWGMADPRSRGDVIKSSGIVDKMQLYAIGYSYNFSKRTSMYAVGAYVKNYSMLKGLKAHQAAVGLVHKF